MKRFEVFEICEKRRLHIPTFPRPNRGNRSESVIRVSSGSTVTVGEIRPNVLCISRLRACRCLTTKGNIQSLPTLYPTPGRAANDTNDCVQLGGGTSAYVVNVAGKPPHLGHVQEQARAAFEDELHVPFHQIAEERRGGMSIASRFAARSMPSQNVRSIWVL